MISRSFKQKTALFLHELQEQALSELKRTDKRYVELCVNKKEIGVSISAALGASASSLFEEYNEITAEINAIEYFHLYVHGIKECMNTPKVIETMAYGDTN